MRMMIAAVALLLSTTAAAAPELAGTWNVSATEVAGGTCPQATPGKTYAYIWIVGTQPDGGVSVSVQGETTMPTLAGTLDAKSSKLSLQGATSPKYDNGYRSNVALLSLEVKGNEIVGVRRFLSFAEATVEGKKRVTIPCFIDMDVKAKR